MPKFKMLAPGGWGEKSLRDYNYSTVMEVDGRIELSGQGGWDPATLEFPTGRPIEAEINQAFDNVAFMLNAVTRISTRIFGSPKHATPKHVQIGLRSGIRRLNCRPISAVAARIVPSGSTTW